MKLAKRQTNTMEVVKDFRLQPIVGSSTDQLDWYEMLYCPQMMSEEFCIQKFFNSMTKKEKTLFDIYALIQLTKLQKVRFAKRISINISPFSLRSNMFFKIINILISNKLLDLSSICLEVVETDALGMLLPEHVENIIKLRSHGALIALDDFGHGFTHWQLLKLGLVDVIKTINNNVGSTLVTNEFLSKLVGFAKWQGAITVLEGIETIEDYENGLSLGYQNFQGFYFNKLSSVL